MDLYPEDKINDETYWKTESDLKNFCQPVLIQHWIIPVYITVTMPRTIRHLNLRIIFVWSDYTIPTAGGGWAKGDWANIRSCNYFLSRYHTVGGMLKRSTSM